MIPETWLPTLTVTAAETAPVAVTVCFPSPLPSVAVRYLAAGLPRFPRRKNSPTPTATTTRTQTIPFLFIAIQNLRWGDYLPGTGFPTMTGTHHPRLHRLRQMGAPGDQVERNSGQHGKNRVRKASHEGRHGQRDEPGQQHVPHRRPAERRRAAVQADPDDGSRRHVRRRDR